MSLKIRPHRAQANSSPAEVPPRPGKVQGRRDAGRNLPRPSTGLLRPNWYVSSKAALDFVVAAVLLVLSAPLLLLAALAVKVTSRGPAFYQQRRVGKDGRIFTIYKIRTMVHNCESLTGPRWSMPGDPRITALGHVLRVSHLDELPQLLNVLRGDMSLIGPRPERPEFLPELEAALPCYPDRLLVRPGVTGLSQVQLPADTSVESVRRKLAYDLYYIHHLNPWLDLRILLCTALYAVGVPFRVSREVFRVPGGDTVARAVPLAPVEHRAPRVRKVA